MALPKAYEGIAPEPHHHPAATLPEFHRGGAWVRTIPDRGFGEESPVRVFADMLKVARDLEPDAELTMPPSQAARALCVLEGGARLDGADTPPRHLPAFDSGATARLRAKTPLKATRFGGEPLDGARHMWWNFVS